MIKRILVPTDGSDFAATAIDYAVSLAERHQARLHALHVIDIKLLEGPFLRDVSAALGTVPFVNYQNNIASILEARGRAALLAFEEKCKAAGLDYETTLESGNVVQIILEQSELADLCVIGRRGEHGAWAEAALGSTTERVVRRARCPVLVTEQPAAELKHIVVAYDGSPHASHALQFAAELVQTWNLACDVMAVGDRAPGWLDEAKAYLDAHGAQVGYSIQEGDPSETIVAFARDKGTDLIVMGAFGHTKVREWVVGSTTAYVMNHAPCPVLLTR